ncbi:MULTISPECIES: lytic transglycosylase domain-containing protein [unclassified Devosia]|uniref:lytic transglycosylase domain-containing protein n=1 Tax=unclassified Devosia TaxID=196773 RepID=UPI00086A8D42|nr:MULTISPECIES: lytic transglycosylase domain-containing protein [unclassified Devosia]MBN9362801.1 lytic transglycosylase domain-containing protein [Devosia sp.]ODS88359.1 MAG: lytic transglycosylase [Devosia sp. SCN 66-27]OJX23976.1 MAG: lytic transglycosylase [Devosia sp. 66-14]
MQRDRIARAIQRHGICCRVAFLLLSGLPVFPPAPAVLAQDVPVAQPATAHLFDTHVAEASQRFRIPEAWIHAVLDAESAHDIGAVSDAGAMGLMQIMPDTWAELRVRYSFGDDPFDPRDNILAGTAYLREMLDRYGNVAAMLAAYNAGLGRYDEYLSTGRPLPAETRAYVAKLAPILGGEALPGGASTTPSPPTDWREAPLFVAPALGGSPAGSPQPGGQSDADPTHDDDATSFPAAGIFVARSEGNSSP